MLKDSGFVAHAHMWDDALTDSLVAAGNVTEAALIAANAYWDAMEAADSSTAASVSRRFDAMVNKLRADADEGANSGDSKDVTSAGSDLWTAMHAVCAIGERVASQVVGVVSSVLAEDDLIGIIQATPGNPSVSKLVGRLLVFLAQASRAAPLDDWAEQHAALLRSVRDELAGIPSDPDALSTKVRLDLEVADATGDWTGILGGVARRHFDRSARASIRARAGLAAAIRGDFVTADQLWLDAVDDACLDGDNADAAEWVFARRNLKSVEKAFDPMALEDQRLASTLQQMAGGFRQPPVQRAAHAAAEAIFKGRLREAGLRGREYARLAYAAGNWSGVGG